MRVPPQKGLESSSQIKFHFLGWQAAHRIGIVGIPMRVPPQKGLESSSQIKFFFLGWQATHRIGIVGIPVPLILLPHAVRELARPSKHKARPCPFNTSVPVRLPPQKGLESSSGSRQQALGIAVRVPVRLPSSEWSRKFFSKSFSSSGIRQQAVSAPTIHRRCPNARPSILI